MRSNSLLDPRSWRGWSGSDFSVSFVSAYTLAPGDQGKVQKAWAPALAEREKISPVIATWYSELGRLNKFVHIWPYKSLDARTEARGKAIASGTWPPSGPYNTVAQENKILLAAPFSPIR